MSLSGSDPIDKTYLEEFLTSIVTLTDDAKRCLAEAFKVLPSKLVSYIRLHNCEKST